MRESKKGIISISNDLPFSVCGLVIVFTQKREVIAFSFEKM